MKSRGQVARRLLIWSGLAVSVVFAYLALRGVHPEDTWAAFRASNAWWIVPAFAMLALGIFVRALRWRLLFAPGARPPLRAVSSALLIGYFFNNILPARAGEAARVVALRQRARVPAAESAATVVLERMFDVLSLLALFFVALPWTPDVSWTRAAGALAGALVVGSATLIFVLAQFGARPLHALLRPLAVLPFLSSERLGGAAENALQGLVALRRVSMGVGAFVLTSLSWIALAFSFWFLMLGFDLDLSPVGGLLVLVATSLALIVPSGPGALGVFEAAAVVALAAYDVPRSQALSYALVLHALNFVPFVVVGYVILHVGGTVWGEREPASPARAAEE